MRILHCIALLPVGLIAGARWVATTRGSTRVTLRTGVVIMGTEGADVTTTTSTTIGTEMLVQSIVGEGLAIGFGAGEALSTIGLDHARSTLQWTEQGVVG